MAIRIAPRSRLQLTDLIEVDGVVFWDVCPQVDVPEQNDDIQYSILDHDRVDTIAMKFYNDPTLWWIIAQANDWELVPQELEVGTVVRIPSPRYVLDTLFGKKRR